MTKASYTFAAVLLCISCSVVAQDFSDGFPDSYIKNGLIDARKNVVVNIAHLGKGESLSTQYAGRPILIYRRTKSDIQSIETANKSMFADPEEKNYRAFLISQYGSSSSEVWARLLTLSGSIAKLTFRSIDKEFLVVGGWSSESGCEINFVELKNRKNINSLFHDPCTGAQFDGSGRILSGSIETVLGTRPSLYNLPIPPYQFEKTGRVILGVPQSQDIPQLNFTRDELYNKESATRYLISATRYNDIDGVREALKKGGDVNFYKPGIGSPIDAAVIGSSAEIIKLLVKNGARPTPNTMNAAAFVGRETAIDYLRSIFK